MITLNEDALDGHVVNYIKSKGRLRGVLYFKLEKRFCSRDSKIRVRKNQLLSCLFSMMKERIIEIIIPEPFDIEWSKQKLSGLKFIKEDVHLKRYFSYLKGFEIDSIKKNEYIFDSRQLNRENLREVEAGIQSIKELIKQTSGIKYKILVFYPKNSVPLNIYEPFEGDFNLDFIDIKAPPEFIEKGSGIEIPLNQQELDLTIIRSYRSNYMCFYITLIESLQKAILNLQEGGIKSKEEEKTLEDLITKFTYYCEMYVNSDWVDIQDANPYRWETFFKFFKIPIKILKLEYKSIKFHGRTFETWSNLKFCIFIDSEEDELITNLKKLGYQEFRVENITGKVAIGLDIDNYVPCPAIEYLYFVFKYICYYHLFLLFSHSFSYIKRTVREVKFSEKDKYLYKIIEPIIKSLFNVNTERLTNKVVLKYYTLNADELEVIYNSFMVNKIRKLEKSLYSYFMLRSLKK